MAKWVQERRENKKGKNARIVSISGVVCLMGDFFIMSNKKYISKSIDDVL